MVLRISSPFGFSAMRPSVGKHKRSTERLKALFGLADACETYLAAEHNHGFKQRRCILAPTDCNPDGLEHRPGLEAERGGGFAKRLFKRIVIERGCRQRLLRSLEHTQGQRGVPFLRDQLGWVIGRKLIDEKEIGGGDGFAQQPDALVYERRDSE